MTQIDTPNSHNPMTLLDVRDWLRWNAPSIQRLVKLGEREAKRVEFVYRAWYRDPENPALQEELLTVVKAFMVRDMTVTERAELERKFGYKVPE